MVEPAENLTTPALLEFAGISPTIVPCYPLTQQIAEKVHAYWSTTFRKMAKEVNLGYHTLADAGEAVARFLNPRLQGQANGIGDPVAWSWR